MSLYEKIKNPKTGRYVNTNGTIGIKILKKYIQQLGGSAATPPWERIAEANAALHHQKRIKLEDGLDSFKQMLLKLDALIAAGDRSPAVAAMRQNTLTNIEDSIAKIGEQRDSETYWSTPPTEFKLKSGVFTKIRGVNSDDSFKEEYLNELKFNDKASQMTLTGQAGWDAAKDLGKGEGPGGNFLDVVGKVRDSGGAAATTPTDCQGDGSKCVLLSTDECLLEGYREKEGKEAVKVGDRVEVRWKSANSGDGRYYPAIVTSVNSATGSIDAIFDNSGAEVKDTTAWLPAVDEGVGYIRGMEGPCYKYKKKFWERGKKKETDDADYTSTWTHYRPGFSKYFNEKIIYDYPPKMKEDPAGNHIPKSLSFDCDLFPADILGKGEYLEGYYKNQFKNKDPPNGTRQVWRAGGDFHGNSHSEPRLDYNIDDKIELYQMNPYYSKDKSTMGWLGAGTKVHYVLHITSKVSGCTRVYGLGFATGDEEHLGLDVIRSAQYPFRSTLGTPDSYTAMACRWRAKQCLDANSGIKLNCAAPHGYAPHRFCGGITDITGPEGEREYMGHVATKFRCIIGKSARGVPYRNRVNGDILAKPLPVEYGGVVTAKNPVLITDKWFQAENDKWLPIVDPDNEANKLFRPVNRPSHRPRAYYKNVQGTNYLPKGTIRGSATNLNSFHLAILKHFHKYAFIEKQVRTYHDGFKSFSFNAPENHAIRYQLALSLPWHYAQPHHWPRASIRDYEQSVTGVARLLVSGARQAADAAATIAPIAGAAAAAHGDVKKAAILMKGRHLKTRHACLHDIVNCASVTQTIKNNPEQFIIDWNTAVEKILRSRLSQDEAWHNVLLANLDSREPDECPLCLGKLEGVDMSCNILSPTKEAVSMARNNPWGGLAPEEGQATALDDLLEDFWANFQQFSHIDSTQQQLCQKAEKKRRLTIAIQTGGEHYYLDRKQKGRYLSLEDEGGLELYPWKKIYVQEWDHGNIRLPVNKGARVKIMGLTGVERYDPQRDLTLFNGKVGTALSKTGPQSKRWIVSVQGEKHPIAVNEDNLVVLALALGEPEGQRETYVAVGRTRDTHTGTSRR